MHHSYIYTPLTSGIPKNKQTLVDSLRPWMTIWTQPRETFRYQLHIEKLYLPFPIVILMGVALASLTVMQTSKISFNSTTGLLTSMAGILFWLLFSLIYSACLNYSGVLLNARGTYKQIVAALHWSMIPLICTLPFTLVIGIISDSTLLVSASTPSFLAAISFGVITTAYIFTCALILWSIKLMFVFIAQVQRISVPKTIINTIFACIYFLTPLSLIYLVMIV